MSRPPSTADPAEPPVPKTTTVRLRAPLPVYVAYFTAAPGADGTMTFPQDVYGRDALISDPASRGNSCDTSGIQSIDAPPPKPRKSNGEGDQGP
jgi:hypothetical protein